MKDVEINQSIPAWVSEQEQLRVTTESVDSCWLQKARKPQRLHVHRLLDVYRPAGVLGTVDCRRTAGGLYASRRRIAGGLYASAALVDDERWIVGGLPADCTPAQNPLELRQRRADECYLGLLGVSQGLYIMARLLKAFIFRHFRNFHVFGTHWSILKIFNYLVYIDAF